MDIEDHKHKFFDEEGEMMVRMAGKRPIECMTCGKQFSWEEFLQEESE